MNTSFLRAACAQYAPSDHRKENMDRVDHYATLAAKAGVELLLLPELSHSLYFCQTRSDQPFSLAETLDGPSVEHWARLARRLGLVIVGSLFEKEPQSEPRYFNTAVVLDKDGSLAGSYRKMHLPEEPRYHEQFYFSHGTQGFRPIPTSLGKLGVLVCWDQWFPEAARAMALAGAELLLYPTAIGWDESDNSYEHRQLVEAWTNIQRGHAVANHLPVITCNRVGREIPAGDSGSGLSFWGSSFILGSQGQFLAQGSVRDSVLLTGLLDLGTTQRLRDIWPFFRDRKEDYRVER